MEQISLNPTEKRKLNIANIVMACITVLAVAGAVTFGILWGIERNKTPEVVVKDCSPCTEGSAAVIRTLNFNPENIANDASNGYYNYFANNATAELNYSDGTIAIQAVSRSTAPNKASLKLNWADLNAMYKTSHDEATNSEIELEFPQNISDIIIIGAGQTVGMERILFLMEDGSVEYVPVAEAVKENNFASRGKVENLKNIVKFYKGGFDTKEGVGGGAMSYAQDADGKIYLLYSVSQHD